MPTYILFSNGVLEKDGVETPAHEFNPDYIEYLAWVALGNQPTLQDVSVYNAKRQIQAARRAAAKPFANSIPNWAGWSQDDWTTYFNANLSDSEVDLVTSLATARVMLKRQNLVIQNLAKLLIAMRDQLWPDLPE